MGNGIIKNIKKLLNCIIELIYDTDIECIFCGKEVDEKPICDICFNKILSNPLVIDIEISEDKLQGYSAGYYSKYLKELIIRLKYKGDYRSGTVIAYLLEELINIYKIDFDLITFVPSSKKTLKKRGYNQAEYIALSLAKIREKKIVNILKKHKETHDQIGLSKDDRWSNMQGSFSIQKNISIKGLKILLIDDVITTGATAFNCYKILKENGAEKVTILTAAKSNV